MHTSAGGSTKCGSPRLQTGVVHTAPDTLGRSRAGGGNTQDPLVGSVPSDFASATWPKRSRTSLLRDRRPATSFCQESPKRPPGCPAIDGVSKTPEGKKQREIGLRHVDGRSSAANDGRLTLPGRKRRKKMEIFTVDSGQWTRSAPVSDRREKGSTHRVHPIRSAPHELTNRANSNDVPFSQLCSTPCSRVAVRGAVPSPRPREIMAVVRSTAFGGQTTSGSSGSAAINTHRDTVAHCLSQQKRYEPLGSVRHSQPGASPPSLSCALWGGCRGHSIADGRVEAVTSTHKRIRPVEGRLDRAPHHLTTSRCGRTAIQLTCTDG